MHLPAAASIGEWLLLQAPHLLHQREAIVEAERPQRRSSAVYQPRLLPITAAMWWSAAARSASSSDASQVSGEMWIGWRWSARVEARRAIQLGEEWQTRRDAQLIRAAHPAVIGVEGPEAGPGVRAAPG